VEKHACSRKTVQCGLVVNWTSCHAAKLCILRCRATDKRGAVAALASTASKLSTPCQLDVCVLRRVYVDLLRACDVLALPVAKPAPNIKPISPEIKSIKKRATRSLCKGLSMWTLLVISGHEVVVTKRR